MTTPKRTLVVALVGALLSLPTAVRADDAKQAEAAEARALEKFVLTAPLVEKLIAVNQALTKKAQQDAGLRKALRQGSGASVAEIQQGVERVPPMLAAVKDAGLTPRQYALATFAAFTCSLWVAMEQQGMKATERPPGLSPANLAFVKKETALFERLSRSAEALARAAEADVPSTELEP